MKIAYACRSSWHWVFKEAFEGAGKDFRDVRVVKSLRLLRKEFGADCGQRKGPSTFSFATTTTNDDGEAVGTSTIYTGDSEVFEDLEDKDDFVRSVTEAGAEAFIVESTLIDFNFHLQSSQALALPSIPAVFKTPMGSCGNGIHFVSSVEEVLVLIAENYNLVSEDENILESIQASKGRIPQFVLQKEVRSRLLDGRKFHLRTYVLAIERGEGIDIFLYVREHEVRAAKERVEEIYGDDEREDLIRNRAAHITNGASGATRRLLLRNVEELCGLKGKVEIFVADFFRKMQGIMAKKIVCDGCEQKFGLAAVDVMCNVNNLLAILEVNAYPAAPGKEGLFGGEGETDEEGMFFSKHLVRLGLDLFNFVSRASPTEAEVSRDDEGGNVSFVNIMVL
ncbi:hypothetical protein TrVE_jg2646 [Triparma verrucosa]|uniref:Uncharacterized protein n=1 Tax=Triparma verrucosa TaxID=1606542 RepID=A0A9W7BK54_9STRA|nr:hypothetical protein TrVE_jg2646 [Triparma verrucosa]